MSLVLMLGCEVWSLHVLLMPLRVLWLFRTAQRHAVSGLRLIGDSKLALGVNVNG